ncbi:AMP-binding protein [Xylanimonas ulmi]|uniref:Acyl-CoA synthetase (AMP-forming)/AMP-acid ligase II n=1 Tax=Xylanimonas ulmi TaxID=228973 RepID=A0A4Q7M4I6_9MICO|nr:AMP-binding protein [Xylanibacterium ulmi]RZS61542.1 acyl-CoA synthetase (AMP-forming)/AMP-acid ligase II [Xylanibacterium ulmi]
MDHTRSIATMLRHWAHTHPDSPGVSVDGVADHTFASWLEASSRLAAGLRGVGVGPGDRIGFIGKSAVVWAEAFAAASLLRAAAAPLNWRLSPAETAEILADADVAALITEAEFLPLTGRPASDDGRVRLILPDGSEHDYAQFVSSHEAGDDWPEPEPEPEPEDIALLLYTSGTSGTPKGVELPNRAIEANITSPFPVDLTVGDVVMVPAPTFHLSGTGWLYSALSRGAASLFVFDIRPEAVLDVLADGRVTYAITVPAIVQALVQHPTARSRTYPSLRTLIYGGSPMSPSLADAAHEVFDCDLVQGYGLTETCGPITCLSDEDHRRGGARLASAGRAIAGVELGVFDPATGERCATGEVGEVWARTPTIMAGYRNRPQEVRAVLHEDGWFRTGDAGCLDEDGYLFLRDRVKDMIVSGGENVYPVEVENVLTAHPAVRDAAVIGVPDERWGETVKALVVTGERTPDAHELIEFCRERLAHFKCPTSVDVVDSLPRNPTGKLMKRELRAPYWAGRARGIA